MLKENNFITCYFDLFDDIGPAFFFLIGGVVNGFDVVAEDAVGGCCCSCCCCCCSSPFFALVLAMASVCTLLTRTLADLIILSISAVSSVKLSASSSSRSISSCCCYIKKLNLSRLYLVQED